MNKSKDEALSTVDWHEDFIGPSLPKFSKVQDDHISHDWNVKTGTVA